MGERSAVTRRRATRTTGVTEGECVGGIELTPGYSTREIPGRCLKCLADQDLARQPRQVADHKSHHHGACRPGNLPVGAGKVLIHS